MLNQPIADIPIKQLHNYCARKEYHISVIKPDFVLIHKSYGSWI
jgi:hypothetical protein